MSSSKKTRAHVIPSTTATSLIREEVPPTAVLLSGSIVEQPISITRKIIKTTLADNTNSILKPPDEENAKDFLTKHNWPQGLQDALLKSCKKFAIRYFITDDSGSMMTNDGRRLIGSGKNAKMIQCTRWSELTSSLKFHAELAHAAKAPTEFRLLNNCEPIMVGSPGDIGGDGLHAALSVTTYIICERFISVN